MLIVHISDIHWRGISRHEEYTDAFNRLYEKIKQIKPDLIINTGDSFHTKTQGITPEVIEKLTWMFRSLDEIAPTITILGNHDGNLSNNDRQDIVSPIFNALRLTQSILCKQSTSFNLEDKLPMLPGASKFRFHIYSPFDQSNWDNLQIDSRRINVGLFHGSMLGCETDQEFVLIEAEADLSYFKSIDFLLLGDIHKHQWISKRMDKDEILKPWAAYPGSLIQQNFGELETKGFLVWDLRQKDDWDVHFHELENMAPFITVPWMNNVFDTIKNIEDERGNKAFLPGTRYRISSSQPISQIETKQLVNELKDNRKAEEVTFKYEFLTRLDTIETDKGLSLSKTNLKTNVDGLQELFLQYLDAHKENISLTKEQLNFAQDKIKDYLRQVNFQEPDLIHRNVAWSVKNMEFGNIFRYGEKNSIDFKNLNGIVGIFGPNKSGKSSIIGSLMYGLFNTTDRGPVKSAYIINKNKTSCFVDVTFNVGNVDYLVKRQTSRVISKKQKDDEKTVTALNLYRLENDKKIEMNSITREDTDKEIRKLIGTSNDFLLTALSSQGDMNKFINEGATQRKAILSKFLNLDLFEKLHSLCKEDYSSLNEKTKEYNSKDWASSINKTVEEIQLLEKVIEDQETEVSDLKNTIDVTKAWFAKHQHQIEDIDYTKLQNSITKLSLEISQIENNEELNNKNSNALKQQIKDLKKKNSEINLTELEEKSNKLEELKKILSENKPKLSRESVILENQIKSIKKLEVVPCGDSYPTCHFIKDSHEDKKNHQEQINKVETIKNIVLDLESTVNSLLQEKINEKLNEYHSNEQKIKKIEHELNSTLNKLDLLADQKNFLSIKLAEDKVRLQENKSKTSEEIQKEALKKQEIINLSQSKVKLLESTIKQHLIKIGAKAELLEKLKREYGEGKELIEKLKIYEAILSAFSKTGIPSIVLKTQLPTLNAEITKILSNIVDFKIILETDINSNAMDVYIQDAHSKRVIELASGMEKMICSIALRVALLNISSLPRPDMFIVDEGWGTLDEHNINKCMELFVLLKNHFKTVLVISHINQIKEIVDQIIEIKHDDLESYVRI